ncbi:hypothetical protein BST93_12680 [Nonlabens tegetincola]|nr:hypothetical protein BST93_12680 [Nonlabens tegetincola]
MVFLNYIPHLLKSVHLHGIHSPFIFDFQHQCLYDKKRYQDYDELLRFRESVKNDKQILKVEDFGAGSRIFKNNIRKTDEILRHNCSTIKKTKILFRIARYFKIENALELGTSLGLGSHALSTAQPKALIDTVEGSKEVSQFASERLKNHLNVKVHNNQFLEFLHSNQCKPNYDLIFLDGHHDGTATVTYFNELLKHSHDQTIFILDDINWSKDMNSAWKTLQKHPRVTASIDTFKWGFIWTRPEQRQQSFHIFL